MDYQFRIELLDNIRQATSRIRNDFGRTSTAADDASNSVRGFLTPFRTGLRRTVAQLRRVPNSVNNLNDALRRLESQRDNSFDTREIRQFNREIERTERRINRLRNTQNNSGSGSGFGISGLVKGNLIASGIESGTSVIANSLAGLPELAMQTTALNESIKFSGGEEGALKGPSIMPSGDKDAYNEVAPFLETISAKDQNNLPCCTYVGPEGSGHFIKMVHNGVEYVEMQLLAEVSTILEVLGKNPDEIANTLESWKDSASSYLLEITTDIFRKKEGNDWLVKKILDKAGNKGTGNWTTIASAELGVPSTLIASALFSRYISFYKEERTQLSKNFKSINTSKLNITTNDVLEAYQFARIINHYQGFKLIAEASNKFSWDLNLSEIARIWTGGCIIRSTLMEDLVEVFKKTTNILTNPQLINSVNQYKSSVKKVVSQCIDNELTTPSLSESIQFLNGISTMEPHL